MAKKAATHSASARGPGRAVASLLPDFVAEAREHIENVEMRLVEIAAEPRNADALHAAFRGLHNLKGVAGFVAYSGLAGLAHAAEGVIAAAREGNSDLGGGALDLLFDACEALRGMVHNLEQVVAEGRTPPDAPAPADLVRQLDAAARGGVPIVAAAAEARRLGEILIERGLVSAEDVASALADQQVAAGPGRLGDILIQRGVVTREQIDRALVRQCQPVSAPRLGEALVRAGVTSSIRVEEALRQQQTDPKRMRLGRILVGKGFVTPEDLEFALGEQRKPPTPRRLGEILVAEGQASARDVAGALRLQRWRGGAGPTVRVEAERLRDLAAAAEELVSASDELDAGTGDARARLRQGMDRLRGSVGRLLRRVHGICMASAQPLFDRLECMALDLARRLGKQIRFRAVGGEVELDRVMIEGMSDPLMHLVRNAVDHGVEEGPEARRAAGKPAVARVEVRLVARRGGARIEVVDDGRGLDVGRIRQVAEERGLATPDEALAAKDVERLVLTPGFTTAREATLHSGRGVGLDVALRRVEAMGGRLSIWSRPGRGVRIRMDLPLDQGGRGRG